MTDLVQSKAYNSWMAIDIAKDFNVVMVETLDGNTKRFRMANSHSDHDRLVEVVRSLPQPCRIGFEATGNYHRTLAFRLVAEGFDVCLISSLASARYREVMFNFWDKNDPKDAGESPRVWWRLQHLREWSHEEETESIYTGRS